MAEPLAQPQGERTRHWQEMARIIPHMRHPPKGVTSQFSQPCHKLFYLRNDGKNSYERANECMSKYMLELHKIKPGKSPFFWDKNARLAFILEFPL